MKRWPFWMALLAAVIACAGGFFWFVWPTPYEYTRQAPDVWRVNRFTGIREAATGHGWVNQDAEKARRLTQQVDEALAKKKKFTEEAQRVTLKDDTEYTFDTIDYYNPTETNFEVLNATIEYRSEMEERLFTQQMSIDGEINARSDGVLSLSFMGDKHVFPASLSKVKKFVQVVKLKVMDSADVTRGMEELIIKRPFEVNRN